MVKFKVVGKALTNDLRGRERMLVQMKAVEADGFGSDEANAAPPSGEVGMLLTLDEATKYDIGDEFTLRES